MKKVTVVNYDPAWPDQFEQLCEQLRPLLGDIALTIEHVGSTAIPGLAAKPILDIDIVVADDDGLRAAIDRLESIEYRHRGDLGVEGRHAFAGGSPTPPHHLYVCLKGSLGLRNHLAVRNALLSNPELVLAYGQLKRDLAERHPEDIEAYIAGKTAFLVRLLGQSGFHEPELKTIREINGLGAKRTP